jgi:arylsulfatase A-like enzyme
MRAIILVLLAVVGASPPADRPNIILIFADDIGIDGFGCSGGSYKTPRIDALAQSGLRYESCFSAPLCGPSRAQILTGRYGFRTGVVSNNTGGKMTPKSETVIAKVLKQAGYATAVAGKWRQLEYLTTAEEAKAWGFDESMTSSWGSLSTSSIAWASARRPRSSSPATTAPRAGATPSTAA